MKGCKFLVFLLLVLVAGIYFSGSAFAQACSGVTDATILRLSGETNAHGEFWNGTGLYPEDICFNELFPTSPVPVNPYLCNGNNVIVRLTGETNAHAENPSGGTTGYSDLCYGNLNCQLETGSCSVGTEVIALSAGSNAHLENASANAYTNLICCTIAGDISDLRWEDFSGQEINESWVNRTVKLVAVTSFPNTAITFEVREDDGVGGSELIRTFSAVTTDGSGRAEVSWFISDADATLGNTILVDPPWEFYFTAAISGETNDTREFSDSNFDGILHTYDFEGTNTGPIAVITGVEHAQIYYTGLDLEFNASNSYDVEGPIATFNWTIEFNGVVEMTENSESFTQQFATPGMRTITLRVTDEEGLWHEKQIAILIMSIVLDDELAFINKPFHREVVSTPGAPGTTDFSANDSYVVESLFGGLCPIVTCLAGNCPLDVKGLPSGCAGINVINAPGNDFSNLNFQWTFGQGSEIVNSFGGLNNVSGWQSYTLISQSRDDKWINLSVSYDPDQLNVNVSRIFTLGQCLADGSQYVETDGAGNFVTTHGTLNSAFCAGADGLNETADDCCPLGFRCNIDPSETIGCIASSSGFDECTDYQTQSECENDIYGLGDPLNPTYEGIINCPGTADVSCLWNATTSGCDVEIECQGDSCVGDSCDVGPCIDYSCSYDYPESECVNGYLTISYEVVGFDEGTCNPPGTIQQSICDRPPVTVPCGRLNFELSFFDYQQFFISALVIFLVYLLINLKRKKE